MFPTILYKNSNELIKVIIRMNYYTSTHCLKMCNILDMFPVIYQHGP